MRSIIRLAVCVVMAATATTVLADGDPASTTGDNQIPGAILCFKDVSTSCPDVESSDQTMAGAAVPTEDESQGAGSGEPRRLDTASRDADGSREYNAQRFLNEVWTAP